MISIHAPREGGDPESWAMPRSPGRFQSTPPARGATALALQIYDGTGISIHAPREGGDDQFFREHGKVCAAFQSTPPARGATKQVCRKSACVGISIHAPREGGDFFLTLAEFTLIISIHAPREGGDLLKGKKAVKDNYFNPRPPRGGRLGEHHGIQALRRISIHAPREGGDLPVAWPTPLRFRIFQSTPPARGATRR